MMKFIYIVVFFILTVSCYSTEIFYPIDAIGNGTSNNLAAGQPDAGAWWSQTEANQNRAQLGRRKYVITRNFGITDTNHTGPVGIVKAHMEYTYYWGINSSDSYKIFYSIYNTSEASATNVYNARTGTTTFSYVYDVNISDDYTQTVDYTSAQTWNWSDISLLNLIFKNVPNNKNDWANVDSIWLEVGSAVDVISFDDLATSGIVAIGSQNNPILLGKLKAHNYSIMIDGFKINVVRNDYDAVSGNFAVSNIKIWEDFNKNAVYDEADILLSTYNFSGSSDILNTDVTLNTNFNLSGEKWIIITTDTPYGVSSGKTAQLKITDGNSIIVASPEMVETWSGITSTAVNTVNPLSLSITDFYPNKSTVISGEKFNMSVEITAAYQSGDSIMLNSNASRPFLDYYGSNGGSVSYSTTFNEPLSLNSGASGTISVVMTAENPGNIYFGAFPIGHDTVTGQSVEGGYKDSKVFTNNHYGTDSLMIISGISVSGVDLSPLVYYQNDSKKPVMKIILDAVNQYNDIGIESIKVTRNGTSSDSDIGTVYIYTDSNNDNDISGETLISSGSLNSGSIVLNFPTNQRTINAGTSRNLLLCTDISSTATENSTLGFSISSKNDISLLVPDEVKNLNFPLSTSLKNINSTSSIQIVNTSILPADVFPSDNANLKVGFELKNMSSTSSAKNIQILTDSGGGILDTETTGNASVVSKVLPVLTLATLSPLESKWFTWEYSALHSGTIRFSCYAQGQDLATNVSIMAPKVWSNYAGIKGTITPSGNDIAPNEVGPGQGTIPMLQLLMSVDNNSTVLEKANVKRITVNLSFTGACTISDILKLSIYRDSNNNGIIDNGEVEVGSVINPSINQIVDINLSSYSEISEGTQASFIISVDLNGTAPVGVGNSIGLNVINGGIEFYSPVTVNSHGTFPSGSPVIIEIHGALTVESITPSTLVVEPNQNFNIDMTVKNISTYASNNDISNTEYKSNSFSSDLYHYDFGTGSSISLVSSPTNSPYGNNIPKDSSVVFSWTYNANLSGKLEFSGWSSGVDVFSGKQITSSVLTSPVIYIKNLLSIEAQDLGKNYGIQGKSNLEILSLNTSSLGVLDLLRIDFNITADSFADIDYIKVYEDVNSNGKVDISTDVLLGSASVNSSTVSISFPLGMIPFNNSSKKLLVAVAISASGVPNNTFSISISDNTSFGVTSGLYNDVKPFSGLTSTTCIIKKIGDFKVNSISYATNPVESGNNLNVTMNVGYDVPSGYVASQIIPLNMIDFDSDATSNNHINEDNLNVTSSNGGNLTLVSPPGNDPVATLSAGNTFDFTFVYKGGHAGDVEVSGWGVATPEASDEMISTAKLTSTQVLHIDNYLSCSAVSVSPANIYQGSNDVELLKMYFSLKNSGAYPIKLTSIKVKNIATPKSDSDFSSLKLYLDTNCNGIIDSSDFLVSSNTFSGSQLNFNISSSSNYGYIDSSMKCFIIASDVAPNSSTSGNKIQLEITDSTYIGVESPNSVFNNNFPIQSGISTIQSAVTVSVLSFVTTPAPPTEIEAGSNITVDFTVKNNDIPGGTNYTLSGVTIESNDANPDELDKDTNGTSASVSLVSAPADGNITLNQQYTTPDEHTFTWTYKAVNSGQLAFKGWGFGHDDVNNVDTNSPDAVSNGGSYLTIKKTLNIDITDISPSSCVQGESDIEVLGLSFSHSVADFKLYTIEVTNSGTILDSDISSVKLYLDNNGNGIIDAGETVISSGTFSSGKIVLSFLGNDLVNGGVTKNFIISADLKNTADDTKSIQFQITSLSSISIENNGYEYKTSVDSFPFSSTSINILKKGILTITNFNVSSTSVNSGDNIAVTLTVRNDGEITINNVDFDSSDVNIDELNKIYSGNANVSFTNVTSHPVSSLAPAATTTFTWNYNAGNQGSVIFEGFCMGVDSSGNNISTSLMQTPSVTISPSVLPSLSTSFISNSYYSDDQSSFDLVLRSSNGGQAIAYNVEIYPDSTPTETWLLNVTGDTTSISLSNSPSINSDISGGLYTDFTYTYNIVSKGVVVFQATSSGNTLNDDTGSVVTSSVSQYTVTIQSHAQPQITGFTVENTANDSSGNVEKDLVGDVVVKLTVKNTGEADLNISSLPTLVFTGSGAVNLETTPTGGIISGGQSSTYTYTYTATGNLDTTVSFSCEVSGTDSNSGNVYNSLVASSTSRYISSSLTLDKSNDMNGASTNTPVIGLVTPSPLHYYAPIQTGQLYILDPATGTSIKTYDYSSSYDISKAVSIQPFSMNDLRYYFVLKDKSSNNYYLKGNRDENGVFSEQITKSIGSFSNVSSYSVLNISSDGANSIFYIGLDNYMHYYGLPPMNSNSFSFETSVGPFGVNESIASPIATYGGDYGEFLMFYVNDSGNNRYYLYSADPVTGSGGGPGDIITNGQIIGDMNFDWINNKFITLDNTGRVVKFNTNKTKATEVNILTLSGNTLNTFSIGPIVDTSSMKLFFLDDQGWIYSINLNFTGSGDANIQYRKVSNYSFPSPPVFNTSKGYLVVCDANGDIYSIRMSNLSDYRSVYSMNSSSQAGPSYSYWHQKILDGNNDANIYIFNEP